MSNWVIDKEFNFCYGHRVWSQQLVKEFCASDDFCTKCRHLHGHEGKLNVFLEGNTLERGMVTDFKHLGWLKNFLDDNVDHKFIIDMSDPWFEHLLHGQIREVGGEQRLFIVGDRALRLKPIFVPNTTHCAGWTLDVDALTGAEQEVYEGFFLVNFIPTSENLCKWVYDCIVAKMSRLDVNVQRVEWNETPKSRSTYFGE